MRQRHQYRILQAAFVLLLIWVAFFGAYQGGRHPLAEPIPIAPQNGTHYVEKVQEDIWHKLTDPVALVTLLLVIVTWRMATSIREQVRLGRDEFIATHRPKIILRRACAPIDDPLKTNIAIAYTLVNVGESRAIVERVSLRLDFKPQSGYPIHGEPIANDAANMLPAPIIIAPGEAREIPYVDPVQGWDRPRRETYDEPKQGLFFIGLVEYVDDSPGKTKRRTAWYRKYSTDSQSFGRLVWDAPNEFEYED